MQVLGIIIVCKLCMKVRQMEQSPTFCRVPLKGIWTWQRPRCKWNPRQTGPTQQALWVLCTWVSHPLSPDWRHLCWVEHSRLVYAITYSTKTFPKMSFDSPDRYSPELAPYPARVFSVNATKKVRNPTSMSAARAGQWVAMMTVWGQKSTRGYNFHFWR